MLWMTARDVAVAGVPTLRGAQAPSPADARPGKAAAEAASTGCCRCRGASVKRGGLKWSRGGLSALVLSHRLPFPLFVAFFVPGPRTAARRGPARGQPRLWGGGGPGLPASPSAPCACSREPGPSPPCGPGLREAPPSPGCYSYRHAPPSPEAAATESRPGREPWGESNGAGAG